MSANVRQIILVGLGTAGTTHLEVLEDVPGADVIAAVDKNITEPVWFAKKEIPVFQSVRDASATRAVDADLVVIATPTPTHYEVHNEVLRYLPATEILVEKPAASALNAARRMLQPSDRKPTSVALHMAFAPEVTWAVEMADIKRSQLGAIAAIESWSADPYQVDLEVAEERLCNSWLDSGINALSVINRFAEIVSRKSIRQFDGPSEFECILACESSDSDFDALIFTSWDAVDSARSTRIRYESGAELVMDHNAVAGYLKEAGQITDRFSMGGLSIGGAGRRASHYSAMYTSWLVHKEPIASPETLLRLHSLLLMPFC
jgi:predicted dehydrogenase